VVPGVSSCLSAPLSAGIAVTHRDRASSVAIVTGHNADGNDDRLDWCALSKVDTLVVLMGVHNVAHIAQHLMAAGRSADTPAAAVQRAFWPGESVISATLGTIADEVRRAHVEAPATLVIGEVVSLRQKLKGYQQHIGQIFPQAVAPATLVDTSIPVVPLPELIAAGEPGLDALNLEEEICVIPIPCEKETLQ
jgi:precorrin-4 methylase